MDISILFVGNDEFFATLPNQIRDRTAFTVEVITNVTEARLSIEIRPPNILILLVQASVDGSLELCSWLQKQTQLTWIYCILLEDRTQIIAKRSRASGNWEFEVTAAALEEGADAFVWWLPDEETAKNQLKLTHRLLLAQIQVAWRKMKKYRDLMQTNNALSALILADPLTQVNNRRALEWDLPRQIVYSRTNGTPLSLVMLDVDYFKVVNDTYGHLVGDRILQVLAARLRNNLRFHDTPFRYGGEEFLILLRNTNCQDALLVAHRLNRLISSQPFAINDQLAVNVTISLGSACLRGSDDAQGVSLLNRADQYLLEAKGNGRNCAIGCED